MTTDAKVRADSSVFEKHKPVFDAISNGSSYFGMIPCSVNGEESCAIVLIEDIEENGENGYAMTPIFVAVTPGMRLLDGAGVPPMSKQERARKEAESRGTGNAA